MTLRDPFDLVREWFAAYNRGDLAALGSYYGEAASLEHEDGRSDGREKHRRDLAGAIHGVGAGL